MTGRLFPVVLIVAISTQLVGCSFTPAVDMLGRWETVLNESSPASEEGTGVTSSGLRSDPVPHLMIDLQDRGRFVMELRRDAKNESLSGTWQVVSRQEDRVRVAFTAAVEGESVVKDMDLMFESPDRCIATEVEGDFRVGAVTLQRIPPSGGES